jgi:predicted nucleic acid-binding protein
MSHGPHRVISLFLDANILISAAWKDDTEISHIWRFAGIRLLTSQYVMGEVQRNLLRIDQIERLRKLIRSVHILQIDDDLDLPEAHLLPIKDRPVLAGAVQARADYLVSGDKKHFTPLFGSTIRSVRVISPPELLAALRKGSL